MFRIQCSSPLARLTLARLGLVSLVLIALLTMGCGSRGSGDSTAQQQEASVVPQPSRLERAAALSQRGEFSQALELVQQELIASPDNLEAMRLAMAIHGRLNQDCEAAELAVRIAGLDPNHAESAWVAAFDLHLRCGDFAAAERDLKQAEQVAPQSAQVHRLLGQFFNAQGRRYEASQHVRELIRLHVIQPAEILSLVDLRGPFYLVSFEEFADDSQPTLFDLGKARYEYAATRSNQEDDLRLIQRLTEAFPDSTAAAAFYGRMLAETGRFDLMQAWRETLPPGIEEQPEYWHAVGLWLANEDRNQEAVRAFGEAVRRDPGDRESLRAMVSSLLTLGQEEQAIAVRERLAELDKMFRIAKDADEEQARWISQVLQEHTRPWEASAWLMYSAQLGGRLREVIPELDQRHEAIMAWESGAPPERIREARLSKLLGFRVEDWPLPNWETPVQSGKRDQLVGLDNGLQLEEIAASIGLDVQYVSGFPLDGSDMYPYQTNGGGLAALDYDLDGRCDLYVVQSGGKANDPVGSNPNQLFRLLPEQTFREVTAVTQTGDRWFGQGACAGDVNQDGFPDLLVANIGANVVYINQGDGTFREASDLIVDNPPRWTSSLGLADLNGDHLPEIVEINYIDDPQAFVTKCRENYLDCQPQAFRKCADYVYQGQPDGSFAPWPDGFGSEVTPKLGFGLIIANFDRKHGNDIFISNDGDLNHYWVSTPDSPDDAHRWEMREAGTLHGCSIGRGGNSQACMGIASGDFNRDGTLDLHVTNFLNEPVNLFLQSKSGIFVDEAMKYGVAEPSFGVLGFGTQAADFDNDGWLDLAVWNGHVFDGRVDGIPFQMQPQLMRGSREGFALHDAAAAGDFWGGRRVGRTLAVFDWNRDGRMDLIGNHLDAPVALLENRSESGSWLQLELVGVTSERDAIGAEVMVQVGSERWTSWQTGGDGLMATNEPVLHFGLGQAERIDRIEVRWPSGETEFVEDLEVNARYLLIEGSRDAHRR